MQLIQILLPLYDNAGEPLPAELFTEVRQQLADRFGGLTTYSRAPAQGLWNDDGETHHDDIVVFEVMAAELDADGGASTAARSKPNSASARSSSARRKRSCCSAQRPASISLADQISEAQRIN